MMSFRTRRRTLSIVIVAAVVSVLALLAGAPGLRWRTQVFLLFVAGRIPDIELRQLALYSMPGSHQHWLEPLVESRNPYAVIRNNLTSPADIQAGSLLFRDQCSECHGVGGGGGARGPALSSGKFQSGDSDWSVYRTILYGIPDTAMPSHRLADADIWKLVAYLRSGGTPAADAATDAVAPVVNVPYAELAQLKEPSQDWLTFSGSYDSRRHSVLTTLTPNNVGHLAMRWAHQFGAAAGIMEVSPIVRNGVMFVTEPPNRVLALDAATGKTLWAYEHKLPAGFAAVGEAFGQSLPNRGVAVLDDKVFFGTADARLVALSSATGARQWETVVADPATYFIDAAPLAYRDLVVTGAGTRLGGQGFVVALDVNTGKERWRFVVIPKPGEPGSETWEGKSALQGGGPTWLSGSYDPDLDLLVWGVGNPKPDYDAFKRKGDNLYTNSAVALKGTTGTLVWHFQFTPADDHDWDSNQIPVFVDRRTPQGVRKDVLWANRNGFFYVLDRETGQYRNATAFVQQTWTPGMDPHGRPMPAPNLTKNREGYTLYPGNNGGTNWWPPSYDSALELLFVPSLEQKMVYFPSEGSYPHPLGGEPFHTAVRAIDVSTGKMIWEHRQKPRLANTVIGGLLSTSTGLLFGGDDSTFFALDSHNGKPLWSVETGSWINAAPITYSVSGEQFVAIASGRDLFSFALPPVGVPALPPSTR